MTTPEFARQVIAEFEALGLRCVVHGPELHLAVAGLCTAAACTLAAVCAIWIHKRNGK